MAVEYVTQTLAEVLVKGINIRITQSLGEVVTKPAFGIRRITQSLAEVVVKHPPSSRVTQVYAEIIVTRAKVTNVISSETRPVGYDYWPIIPRWDFNSEIDQQPRILDGSISEAMQQRSPDGPNAQLRSANLSYSALAVGDKELLLTFCRQHRGTQPFLWKCFPEDTDYTMWRAVQWSDKRDDKGSYSMSIQLQELPTWFETVQVVTQIEVVG